MMRGPATPRPRFAAILVAVLLALVPATAFAHPHIFIKQHVVAQFGRSGLTGFRLTWRFDPMYSSMMRADFAGRTTGGLSAADVKNLHDKSFVALKDAHYFTTVTFNGTQAEIFETRPNRIGVTVPVGASTGPIRVTTPEGTIASTGSYTVM